MKACVVQFKLIIVFYPTAVENMTSAQFGGCARAAGLRDFFECMVE